VEPVRDSPSIAPTFRSIFEAELSFVWNSLRRLGVAERDVEDVAHEVFLVVGRHLGQFDSSRPVRPWLFGIALRCASDYRRRTRHRHEVLVEDQAERPDGGERADEALVRKEERDLARRALLAVPEARRAVLILSDFENVAVQDIAAALGIPLKTAYSRLRVAREELVLAAQRMRKERR
jgi:RNA polymerase sigma-70 factor (ECF subfamily)